MSTKWADYLITEVSYNQEHSRIEKVHIVRDLGDSVGSTETKTRAEVINLLKSDKSIFTAPPSKTNAGKLAKGAEVTYTDDGFIRTVGNSLKRDNLGELPEFEV